jgi:hypothetical protein
MEGTRVWNDLPSRRETDRQTDRQVSMLRSPRPMTARTHSVPASTTTARCKVSLPSEHNVLPLSRLVRPRPLLHLHVSEILRNYTQQSSVTPCPFFAP